MSILSALKFYIKAYTGLADNAPVWVDFLGQDPTQYSIISLPGNRVIETYLDGSTLREFPFALQSMESTADELARLQTSEFYETLVDWFESQTEAGNLPTLESNKEAESIEALGWGYLFQEGQSDTGIYQVQCRLTYAQSV